jgi:CMP/dCMP kinase
MNKNKIALSGDLGSGKTTVSFLLAEKLNFMRHSTGDIQRSLAAEQNMTTLEFNKLSETKEYIDKLIDSKTVEMGKLEEGIVFDSRMAWYFVPHSFGVRLIVDDVIGAERIMGAGRGEVEEYSSLEEALNKISERKFSEKNRFSVKYGVNLLEFTNYDLVIDTSYVNPDQVTELIYESYLRWKDGKPYHKIWINPKNLIPTENVQNLDSAKLEELKNSVYEKGYQQEEPTTIIRYDEKNYIFDGHHRVAAAILNDVAFLPVELLLESDQRLGKGESLESFVKSACQIPIIQAWEQYFQFQFKTYPEWLK